MGMTAYYNENDPAAAAWLRELIKAGEIADGAVDDRGIEEVTAHDVRGFTQCHWFGGIGAWSLALRRGGWDDDRPVWTASLPCQPFSAAGKREGVEDRRHLWPVFFALLLAGKPRAVPVLGEQVSGRGGLEWFDIVSADLEGEGYAVGAVDTCAAGFGAPHLRQRLYWLADGLADADEGKRGRIADGEGRDRDRQAGGRDEGDGEPEPCRDARRRPGPVNGYWAGCDWVYCRDGRWRPVEPGAFPLATGAPARVGLLRGYGNSLCVPQAEAFVRAAIDALW
jgi:DNA (cytosine-5)-methyltransferase 1